MKRLLCAILCLTLFSGLLTLRSAAAPEEQPSLSENCVSAILMEASTGTVLYEDDADLALPPASVTKIMTLLLVMEAIEDGRLSYTDTVTASAHACSMGGSQIYLKEGEQMSVEDLIKSVVIASANDAALALAEHLCGSEEAFVARMNERASELSMKNTHFENTNGLDDTVENHVTSARDIAIMSRELLRHERITEFSSIWMDTIRGGAFGLTNTNRLVRFYRGATGLKTGSTAKAKFCISATAERDGMSLICVVMAAPTRDLRNATATALLDWGFANYTLYRHTPEELPALTVTGGVRSSVSLSAAPFSSVIKSGERSSVTHSIELPDGIGAPVKTGDALGKVVYRLGDRVLGETEIVAAEEVEKIGFFDVWKRIVARIAICSAER